MISVRTAAKLLGCSEQYVRLACSTKLLGDAYTTGAKRRTYVVFPGAVAKILGVSADEVERRKREIES